MKNLRSQLANHDVNIDESPVELSAGEINAVGGGSEMEAISPDVRWFAKAVIVIKF